MNIKTKISLAAITLTAMLFLPQAFADGGSGISCKNLTAVCPAGQTGSVILSYAATGAAFNDCKDVQKAVNSGQINPWTNKFAQITGGSCSAIAPPVVTPPPPQPPPAATYSYTGYNNTTSACPSTQPNGVINLQQSYEVWSDGSIRNYSAWSAISNNCTAAFQGNESRSQNLACFAPFAEGGNGIIQSSSREIWSDGARGWSPWVTVSNSCFKTVSDVKDTKDNICAEGQTGKIITELRRTHKEYSVDSSKTPAENAALNEQYSTTWTLVVVSNTCKDVPDIVIKEPGTRILTCSSVYGGDESSYIGQIIETGTKVYSYSSATKKTTASFQSNVPVSYNSTCAINTENTESRNEACPNGISGSIVSFINVKNITTFDANKNPTTTKTYPNGANSWYQVSNTCAADIVAAIEEAPIVKPSAPQGLLENNTIKTTSLSTKTDMDTFIKTLDKSTMNVDSNYKLYLIVDDLSTGKYNKANVIKTVNSFKSVTGANPIITLPQSLDKYIGNGDITAANNKDKILKRAELNSSNQAVVTYTDLTKGLTQGKDKTFTIDLFK